ncbi:MAG: biliverdin-producing heme oxygenase [Chthoniobacterales bacterium]|nr:biliverdin-producing heme oxygenase [Chthoniobacterales bacterium]
MTHTTTAPAGIMGRLKSETAAQHAVAEAKPLEAALIAGAIGHEQYRKYLAQRWLIHRELEAATDRALAADARLAALGLPGLYQTANLEADLAHLGVDTATIKPMAGAEALLGLIRDADSSAPLMGIYYVFEGSKNGARFIARALAKAWGKTDLDGLKYLDPHGEAQRGLWMKFREDMNAIAWSDDEQDGMVKAAQTTFDAISALDDEIHAG